MEPKVKIKKYANRRLYNMNDSCYINISDIADMVRSGLNIEVKDAKSGDDLTAATLLQLFLDLENEGKGILFGQTLTDILSSHAKMGGKVLNKTLADTLLDDSAMGGLDQPHGQHALETPAIQKELVELRTAFSQFTKAFRKFDDKS